MAIEKEIWNQSFVAGADLSASANQYKAVKLNAAGQVILCAAVTDTPIGILQNNPKLNGTAEVCVTGVSKVASSAALAIGAFVGTDVAGLLAAYVFGTDTTKFCVGVVIGASGAAAGLATAIIDCASPRRFA